MIDRRAAELPAHMNEIVRVFGSVLRQARELETEKLRFTLYQLELFRDEVAALNADRRAVAAKMSESINRSDDA
jgi:hypothetical protein